MIANESKQVEKLGRFPLPVEVIPMPAPLVSDSLQKLGFTPSIRVNQDGTRCITDEGNLILDCHDLLMENPEEIAAKIDSLVGVVEHGLFLKMGRDIEKSLVGTHAVGTERVKNGHHYLAVLVSLPQHSGCSGKAELSHPPPEAWTSRTASTMRRPRILTAVSSSVRAAL
jgi:hypothetical protein